MDQEEIVKLRSRVQAHAELLTELLMRQPEALEAMAVAAEKPAAFDAFGAAPAEAQEALQYRQLVQAWKRQVLRRARYLQPPVAIEGEFSEPGSTH
jgi:hypothetical protein